MDFPRYDLSANTDLTVFEFVSKGRNGRIQKAIKFSMTLNPQVYNMGFGDITSIDDETGEVEIDDQAVSNNGDTEKVLATVAWSVYAFTERYPQVLVLFGGSNPVKRRLYRMVIAKYHSEISKTFRIFGAIRNKEGQVVNVPYTANENVEGFFVKRL